MAAGLVDHTRIEVAIGDDAKALKHEVFGASATDIPAFSAIDAVKVVPFAPPAGAEGVDGEDGADVVAGASNFGNSKGFSRLGMGFSAKRGLEAVGFDGFGGKFVPVDLVVDMGVFVGVIMNADHGPFGKGHGPEAGEAIVHRDHGEGGDIAAFAIAKAKKITDGREDGGGGAAVPIHFDGERPEAGGLVGGDGHPDAYNFARFGRIQEINAATSGDIDPGTGGPLAVAGVGGGQGAEGVGGLGQGKKEEAHFWCLAGCDSVCQPEVCKILVGWHFAQNVLYCLRMENE